MKFLYSHRVRAGDGQRVHIDALTQALAARGHEVVICGPAHDGALDAAGRRGAAGLLPRPLYECAEYGYSLPAFLRLAAAARASTPDAIYERCNLFFHAGVWTKRKTGLPLILEVNAPLAEERAVHGGLAFKQWARRSEAAVWRAADMTLPVTAALAGRLRAAGVDDEKIEVVHNGVGEDFLTVRDGAAVRARYGLTDKIVLGFAGFVRDWHRLDRVLRFLSADGRDDLHLLVVGDGPARADLQALAERLGAATRATFTGVVQRDVMADHVAAFDIALQPASTEYASPLKLFEYMAQAKAILAPDSANIREILSDGADALLFAEENFERMLTTLAGDAALRGRLGAAARESLIRRDFTWAANARRVEAIGERLKEKTS